MANLNAQDLRRLARLGAVTRLEQIHREEAAIRAEFPELFGRGRRDAAAGASPAGRREQPAAAAPGRRRSARRRRKMSAAERKAVSDRMRSYWAERRKAKAAK